MCVACRGRRGMADAAELEAEGGRVRSSQEAHAQHGRRRPQDV